jgi:CDP-glycerol glycerophosphotransferase (TagB/SpsB family)
LRAANQYVARKFTDRKYKFVFLQHGVMYMVSLSSKGRGFFIKGREMPDDAKIVVSSQVEADHFIEYAGFQQDDLYITGLPFYDRTIKKPDADRITIMLTWRPWEYNVLSSNYQEANYYKMIRRIVESVPAQHRDRVYLLPHPLITDKLQETDLKELIPQALSYDQVLEETDLLITDYSSIAYSAFYRGSKVIFCFQELEECMEHYQGHLMLNEGNIFGDISLDYEGLGALIENNYLKPQSDTYVQRYRKIVEFHDGQNTQRLMDLLKRDRFISP